MKNNIIVQYIWKWERLDIWLSGIFFYSRNFFHHILNRSGIYVSKNNINFEYLEKINEIKTEIEKNIKVVKKSYKLKKWDIVVVDELKRRIEGPILSEASWVDIDIVFECEEYTIIDKPKWVLSHPNSMRNLKTPSVSAFLYNKYKKLPTISNFIRSGIVHRLDKDTDWFMIIPKTEKSMEYFKNLFNSKTQNSISWEVMEKEKLKKEYVAICEILDEKWKKNIEKIKHKLPFEIKSMVFAKASGYKPKVWITKIQNIKKFDKSKKIYIIYLELLTWRTHQIRYHLSDLWIPIVWDKIYNPNYQKNLSDFGQIWLQLSCYKLSFVDMFWKKNVFEKKLSNTFL